MKLFIIGFGGALGAMGRYLLSGWVHTILGADFPWGTLAVNALGSLLMGFLWGAFDLFVVSQNIKVFLLVGVLGSLTTFSTFSLENFQMIRAGEYHLAALNSAGSVVVGIVMVYAGFFSVRFVLALIR